MRIEFTIKKSFLQIRLPKSILLNNWEENYTEDIDKNVEPFDTPFCEDQTSNGMILSVWRANHDIDARKYWIIIGLFFRVVCNDIIKSVTRNKVLT